MSRVSKVQVSSPSMMFGDVMPQMRMFDPSGFGGAQWGNSPMDMDANRLGFGGQNPFMSAPPQMAYGPPPMAPQYGPPMAPQMQFGPPPMAPQMFGPPRPMAQPPVRLLADETQSVNMDRLYSVLIGIFIGILFMFLFNSSA